MATLTHELKATYAFMERNANLVKRYWSWELVWLVYSIANSLSVSYIGLGMVMIAGTQKADGQYLVLYGRHARMAIPFDNFLLDHGRDRNGTLGRNY